MDIMGGCTGCSPSGSGSKQSHSHHHCGYHASLLRRRETEAETERCMPLGVLVIMFVVP